MDCGDRRRSPEARGGDTASSPETSPGGEHDSANGDGGVSVPMMLPLPWTGRGSCRASGEDGEGCTEPDDATAALDRSWFMQGLR